MTIFKVLRLFITIVLVAFLLASGFLSLFIISVQSIILKSSYFTEELLYSGVYTDIYNYIMDAYIPEPRTDDMTITANYPVTTNIVHSINPTLFSTFTSEYLSDWVSYLLAEVDKEDIPVLNIAENKDLIYQSAIAKIRNDEFATALLDKYLQETQGVNASDYTYDEQQDLIELYEIREYYIQSVEDALNNPSSLFYKTAVDNDTLALFKYNSPELSEDELMAKITDVYGKLKYYKSIVSLVFAGMLACLGIIILLWIKKISIGFLLDGIVIVSAGLPLYLISSRESTFTQLALKIYKLLPINISNLPVKITFSDFYNNMAVRPLLDHILIVSGVTIAIGLMLMLFSLLTIAEKKQKKIRPDIKIS